LAQNVKNFSITIPLKIKEKVEEGVCQSKTFAEEFTNFLLVDLEAFTQ